MSTTEVAKDSSVSVERHESGGILIYHFTGILLVSPFEARHLYTLLSREIANVPEMTITEADTIVADKKELVIANGIAAETDTNIDDLPDGDVPARMES